MNAGPVLVVAAHPDDEVLGCGGYLARLADAGRPVHVLILADGETSRAEAAHRLDERGQAAQAAAAILGVASVEMAGFPDNRLDSVDLLDVVRRIEAKVHQLRPTTVLSHHHGDVNVDHVLAHEAVLAACRPLPDATVRELLLFEVPSSTEWRPGPASAFAPNLFVDISGTIERKRRALQAYAGELRPFPHPRSPEAIEALATWRGATVGVARAEAFVLARERR